MQNEQNDERVNIKTRKKIFLQINDSDLFFVFVGLYVQIENSCGFLTMRQPTEEIKKKLS